MYGETSIRFAIVDTRTPLLPLASFNSNEFYHSTKPYQFRCEVRNLNDLFTLLALIPIVQTFKLPNEPRLALWKSITLPTRNETNEKYVSYKQNSMQN